MIADDLLVDRAGQHHFDDFDRRLVGHAQAVGEFRLDAQLGQHGADLRAAAVDHHRIDAGLFEQDHVAGEIARGRLVAHGVAAIFHHHGRFVVMKHVRQRLHQDPGLFDGRGLVERAGGRDFAHEGRLLTWGGSLGAVTRAGACLADLAGLENGPVAFEHQQRDGGAQVGQTFTLVG